MTATAQGALMRCDATGCTQTATVAKDAWAFCATHAGTSPTIAAAGRPAHPSLSRAHTPSPGMPRIVGGGTIGLLLEQASGHSSKRVQSLADRIETQLEQLRALIADLADDEKRKQAEIAAKAAAKAKVARLEAELAAARAALRGKPAPVKTTAAPTAGPKLCRDCNAEIVRAAGQQGALPSRCADCKSKAIAS